MNYIEGIIKVATYLYFTPLNIDGKELFLNGGCLDFAYEKKIF